jgi:DNA-binding response OmpR family regulator
MADRRRILIVDDEPRVLFVLRDTLVRGSDHYEVETASNGPEALRKARKMEFDLVLTDLRMPDLDGIELSREVRARSPGTAIIWMTAFGCHSVEAEAEELSVDRCLNKPVRIGQVREAVRGALRGRSPPSGSAQV